MEPFMSTAAHRRPRLVPAALVAACLLGLSSPASGGDNAPIKPLPGFVPCPVAPNVWLPGDARAFMVHQGGGEAGIHVMRLGPLGSYSTNGMDWIMGGGDRDGAFHWTLGKGRVEDPNELWSGYKKHTTYRSPGDAVQNAIDALGRRPDRVSFHAWCNSARTALPDGSIVSSPGAHIRLHAAMNFPDTYPASQLVLPQLDVGDGPFALELTREQTKKVVFGGVPALEEEIGMPLFDRNLAFDPESGEWLSRRGVGPRVRFRRPISARYTSIGGAVLGVAADMGIERSLSPEYEPVSIVGGVYAGAAIDGVAGALAGEALLPAAAGSATVGLVVAIPYVAIRGTAETMERIGNANDQMAFGIRSVRRTGRLPAAYACPQWGGPVPPALQSTILCHSPVVQQTVANWQAAVADAAREHAFLQEQRELVRPPAGAGLDHLREFLRARP
jgi:hypothetical protein